MSAETVRREIAMKRAQADRMEQTAKDPAHSFTDERHREHLLHEAERLRSEAAREEAMLARRQPPPQPSA